MFKSFGDLTSGLNQLSSSISDVTAKLELPLSLDGECRVSLSISPHDTPLLTARRLKVPHV